MSRSRQSNNVRGPTSALTEFLRESGINPATIARRAATRDQEQGRNDAQGTSTEPGGAADQDGQQEQAQDESPAPQGSTSQRRRRRQTTDTGYASDQLDDVEEEAAPRKTTTKRTAAAKAKAKKKAKKDGDYEGSSEDEYTALPKKLWSIGGSGGPKPPIGSFEKCARCEKQFTVTKYTLAANPPPGYLCHQCAKASGADPFKKPASSKRRKPATERREVINFEERRFPTLACLCIELIGRYIDDVEALGDIGSVNMVEIAKTLARNRSLTTENAQLFYDVQNKKLRLYDATNLTPPALTTLASLNPNLTHLHLDFCGRLTCPVINAFSESLPRLTHLNLLGPFLVRAEAWIEFFKAKPGLQSFRITQSPRFDHECMKSLAENCTQLEELQLKEIGQLDDTFIESLCALPPLKLLNLSHPGIGIPENGWVQILERHGPTLESFDPSLHDGFTDVVLQDGIWKHARVISELYLEGVSSLTDAGVARFFENWNTPYAAPDSEDCESRMEVDCEAFTPNPPLHIVSLARNHALSSAAFTALLAHSASSLASLDLNGLGPISLESLGQLKDASDVRWLDMSWCRELDDFIMKDVVASATKLIEVRVWGCNHVKGVGWADKRGLRVYGIEPNAGS